jgi:hypothetical protein
LGGCISTFIHADQPASVRLEGSDGLEESDPVPLNRHVHTAPTVDEAEKGDGTPVTPGSPSTYTVMDPGFPVTAAWQNAADPSATITPASLVFASPLATQLPSKMWAVKPHGPTVDPWLGDDGDGHATMTSAAPTLREWGRAAPQSR